MYNMILLGSVFYSLTGTVQSDVRLFNNVGSDGRPIFSLPETRTPGSGVRGGSVGTFEFRTANQIDFKPPQMLQWALSVDRELMSNTGLRVSFIGNRSYHLPWALTSTRWLRQRHSSLSGRTSNGLSRIGA
jgi:hypothetical protein